MTVKSQSLPLHGLESLDLLRQQNCDSLLRVANSSGVKAERLGRFLDRPLFEYA